MIKAGALYFAIVIAFFIAIISASIIILASHYRGEYLKENRFQRLTFNLESATTYALAENPDIINQDKRIDLFGKEEDSVIMKRKTWGIYNLAINQSFHQQDTLASAFIIGTDTQKDLNVIYLSDEDRPLAVSGNTRITGNVELPKSGIKQAYAEGKPYAGGEKLVYGDKFDSKRTLNPLNKNILQTISNQFEINIDSFPNLSKNEVKISFQSPTQSYSLSKEIDLSKNLDGNIILYSDTIVNIKSTSRLNNIQIYAPAILVEKGFKGNCQLFAQDSIIVEEGAEFQYPSVLGVIRNKENKQQTKISLGKNVQFNGVLFTYEGARTPLQTLINIGEQSKVKGEIYCTGFLKLNKGVEINGKVSCNRFMMQTKTTLYENFLIDITLNRKARSKYYLSASLFNEKQERKVLKWLN